jgi:hypothetical protein
MNEIIEFILCCIAMGIAGFIPVIVLAAGLGEE